MTFRISVADEDIRFDCAEDETVLDAAERAGYAIPYSCRKGVCSSCEGGLVAGEASVRGQGFRTGPAEGVLLCQTRPRSDLVIAPARIRKVEPIQRKVFTASVRKVTHPAPDVSVIKLRFPIGSRAPFKAGQYLRIQMEDGDSRNYSLANPPQANDGAELHIRHVPGGKFSESILPRIQTGTALTVELPYGEFSLSEEDQGPAILIATGTGFAPIKSIIENQIRLGRTRRLHLYWGANTPRDLYLTELAESWARTHDWLDYTPVVSQPVADWSGRRNFVHLAVLEDFPNLSGFQVYACGAPAMIEAAHADFCAKANLDTENFFSDAFVASGDT